MHVQKLNLQSSKMIIGHDLRTHENYSNIDVDLSKSEKNTIYCDRGIEYLKKRSDEIYIFGRNGKNKNDINYTCSVVVQYPKNCPIDENQFFETMNDYFNFKFGEKNCVCSVVHRDEKGQPHLHYVFMPVVALEKEKKGYTEKLCAKDVVNREMLLKFHQEAEQALRDLTMEDVRLTTEEHRDYVKNMDEYKKINDELKQAKEDTKEIYGMYTELMSSYNELVDKFNKLQGNFDKLRNYFRKHKNAMLSIEESEMEKELQQIDEEINR